MKRVLCAAATAMTISGASMADTATNAEPVPRRYLVERTFPLGALDGVDAAAKKKVNANNKSLGVNWEKSYFNANKTKSYCVYTAPSEHAVREAARLNGLPVDVMTEIPQDIKPEERGAVQNIEAGNYRYLVRRTGVPNVSETADQKFGVKLLTSYGSADRNSSFWVYAAPSYSAVESAARASGAPFESIVEIPVTLYPN